MWLAKTDVYCQWHHQPQRCEYTTKFNLFRHFSSSTCSTNFKRRTEFNVRTAFLLVVFSQYLLKKMVECAWSNNYGPPHGSISYAEYYALQEKHKRLTNDNNSTATYETNRRSASYKLPSDGVNRATKYPVLTVSAFTHHSAIHRPDVQKIRNKTTWKAKSHTTSSKPSYPQQNRRSTTLINNYKWKAVKMSWCEYMETLFGVNKCEKSRNKISGNVIISNTRLLKPKPRRTKTTKLPRINTVVTSIKRQTSPPPIVIIEKSVIKYSNTTGIPPKSRYKVKLCSASIENEIDVEDNENVFHSKFDTCTGFYGKCTRSHSCESNIACTHRMTHEPCCTSPEINQRCPLVDQMGHECRKMNPVNWCDIDEDCGLGRLRTQICCPTGCGYNICLKTSPNSASKSFQKLSTRHYDCPNPSLIPINCFSSRPTTQCSKADECIHIGEEQRRRCCKTPCGYSICMARLTDKWLIT